MQSLIEDTGMMREVLTTTFYAAQILIDFALTAAFIVGVWALYRFVRSWRRELRAERRRQNARRLRAAAHNLRDALLAAQQPWTLPITPAQLESRWRFVQKALAELTGAGIEAEAAWGDAVPQALADLRRCAGDLQRSLTGLVRAGTGAEPLADNEYNRRLDEAVARIEQSLAQPPAASQHSAARVA